MMESKYVEQNLRYRIWYGPDAIYPSGSPGSHCHKFAYESWDNKEQAEAWVEYMKKCDPWNNYPDIADTLVVKEYEASSEPSRAERD